MKTKERLTSQQKEKRLFFLITCKNSGMFLSREEKEEIVNLDHELETATAAKTGAMVIPKWMKTEVGIRELADLNSEAEALLREAKKLKITKK